MKNEFGVALLVKQQGLTFVDVADLYDMINGINVIPYGVQGKNKSAMGFINCTDADLLNRKYAKGSALYEYIKSILDGKIPESEDREYVFPVKNSNIDIYIGYPGEM